MIDDVNQQIKEAEQGMEQSVEHLKQELLKIRTGKANASMLESISVDYYGSMVPLNQVSNVSAPDARTIQIQPWEKNMLPVIERAIFEANLGYTPQNDGELIRISIPPLTQERRQQLVKHSKNLGEETKVGIRNWRHKAMDFVKKAVKNGLPEDVGKRKEGEIQDLTNRFTERVDSIMESKENEIMTV